ncbi:MAG: hypothetical protein JNK72_12420 [Myxococcales bacterium]|nr:hypothetical protein [Myxococcales bacterium]
MNAKVRLAQGLVALGCSLVTAGAAAQTFAPFGVDPGTDRYESTQNFALELRGGPFYPDTDSEFGGRATPLADMFGTSSRVQFGLEFDWQALRLGAAGSLGVGLGAGYTSMSAVAPITQSPMPSDPAQWQRPSGGQETTLRVFPTYGVLVYRFDTLARRTLIPLVPYAKLGLSYSIWWVTNGDETARRTLALSPGAAAGDPDLDQDAIGGSLGTHLALGLMLRLDVFERRAQRSWDLGMGVNHSYLFAEYLRSDPGSLGSRAQMRLGVSTWNVGLAMEF